MFCDIGISGLDGYQVGKAIRGNESLQGTFSISLTGYARTGDLKRAAMAGFHHQLAKPVGIEDLRKALDLAMISKPCKALIVLPGRWRK